IQDYAEKSKPFSCAKYGLVDEIVNMNLWRNYIIAFTESVYQDPESICPVHQMLTPRIIRDYDRLNNIK
ncbi:MAG: glutaconyl-CoA decarboxylase subunit alpha, partial [Peptoniphilus harei]|nr:glutaconyl-CoA decarboxylase subunit alpha [Peptoniphilus harei]